MDWKNGYRKNKGKLLVIGASALVLALIAFSGICLGTLNLCGLRNAAASWGFWEIFGALSAGVVAFLLIRFARARRRRTDTSDSPSTFTDITPEPSNEPAPRADLRQLCDKLSSDDRQALKALMAKHLGDGPVGSSSSPEV
jgi:hypothetical protein